MYPYHLCVKIWEWPLMLRRVLSLHLFLLLRLLQLDGDLINEYKCRFRRQMRLRICPLQQ